MWAAQRVPDDAAVVIPNWSIIKEINAQGTTILLVEQNVFQSLRISNRAYVLETGRVVLSGTGAELLDNAHVRKAFLGM